MMMELSKRHSIGYLAAAEEALREARILLDQSHKLAGDGLVYDEGDQSHAYGDHEGEGQSQLDPESAHS